MRLSARLRRSFQTSSLAWFVARHYLFSRERQALEWLVTAISILGVAVGVSTIISVFGVMDGMEAHIIGQITANVPSLSIHHPDWRRKDPDPKILARVRAHREVRLADPILAQEAMAMVAGGPSMFLMVHATEGIGKMNLFNVIVPEGETVLRPEPGKILMMSSSQTSRSTAGQAVTLFSRRPGKSPIPVPQIMNMQVQQTLKLGNRFFGRFIGFGTWADVRKMAGREKGIDAIHVRLADPMRADAVKAELLQALPAGTRITSWSEDFEQMFSDMKTAKAGMFLVMLMTLVVAALNIIGTLTLIVIQKTREIGILKAMGASRPLLGRIFMAEGALIGVIGSVLGTAGGLAFCGLVSYYKIPMPGRMWDVREIPVELSAQTVIGAAVMAVVISTLAALAPAWRAGRLNPVEALRHE